MKRNIVQVLTTATQTTLEQWTQKLKEMIQTKEQVLTAYEQKKSQILLQLIEAHKKGLSTRQMAEITGIPHTTIARWIKKAKQERAKEDANSNG